MVHLDLCFGVTRRTLARKGASISKHGAIFSLYFCVVSLRCESFREERQILLCIGGKGTVRGLDDLLVNGGVLVSKGSKEMLLSCAKDDLLSKAVND